jgi:hypothetical protein
MAVRYTFANESGNQPASQLDQMFADLWNGAPVQCSASGTNAITLTVAANYGAPASYGTGQFFTFKAAASSTASVTLQVGALPFLPVYNPNRTQAAGGDIGVDLIYLIKFDLSLNGGAGGFIIINSSTALATSNFGFAEIGVNYGLVATIGSGNLNISLKTVAGADASPSSPILLAFPDPTGNGDPIWRTINAALSIQLPSGASLGTLNNVSNRLWIAAFDNSGTVVMGVFNALDLHGSTSLTNVSIYPLVEDVPQNTTGITAGSTSAGVFYTQGGALTAKCFRILGHLDYDTGLTTAGVYSALPSRIRLHGPGSKKPGEVVQRQFQTANSALSIGGGIGTGTTLSPSVNITPSSSMNPIRVRCDGSVNPGTAINSTVSAMVQIGRNSNATLIGSTGVATITSASGGNNSQETNVTNVTMSALDFPGSLSTQNYTPYGWHSGGASQWLPSLGGLGQAVAYMEVEEIMG